MSSRSALDSLLSALIEGWPFDLDSGESIKFLPAVNDRGFFQIGNGAKDFDVKIFLGGAGSYVLFDSGASTVTFSGITLSGAAMTGSGLGTFNSLKINTTSNTVGAAVFGNTIDVTLGATVNTLKVNTTSNTVGAATFGNTVDITGNATLGSAAARPTGFNALSNRYELKWTAGERGKPGLAADAVENTTATFAITDPLFEVSGTNCVSACVTLNTTGGILLTTTGAADDQVILDAHSLSNLSGWKSTAWLSNTSVEWEANLKTGADIVNSVIWAGLKLTNTPVVATDDDQVYFRYETTANAGAILFVSSIGGTDTETNTGVVLANATACHLKVTIDGSRLARAYINGTLVHTTAALATNKSLIPVIGIQTKDVAAASLTVRGQAISKAL